MRVREITLPLSSMYLRQHVNHMTNCEFHWCTVLFCFCPSGVHVLVTWFASLDVNLGVLVVCVLYFIHVKCVFLFLSVFSMMYSWLYENCVLCLYILAGFPFGLWVFAPEWGQCKSQGPDVKHDCLKLYFLAFLTTCTASEEALVNDFKISPLVIHLI